MNAEISELLVEIGCEEIPAGMIAGACLDFQAILAKYLEAESILDGAPVEAFGAPRRLVVTCERIRVRQEDVRREITGPPKSVAFDAEGHPTRAAESFAAKQGVAVANLYFVNTPRGECVAAQQIVVGRAASERLKEILPRAVSEIPWPRSMYWTGKSGLHFIRPIRWIVALLGKEALQFELAGVAAGTKTEGHRFLGKSRIPVTGVGDYLAKLKSNFVLARPEDRRKKVEGELARLASRKALVVNEDSTLADLVVYLNEYPTAILGDFDPSYLDLPEEILITVMRDHQKYFAMRKRDGRLAPHFLAVINLKSDNRGLVRAGHERVLRARFADARFFWIADQKCRLADYLPKLAQVTFHVKLGSYGDKVERIRALGRWLAEQWIARGVNGTSVAAVDRAAELSKCDLVTGMVREFTELQGIIGALYANAQGEPEEISNAVYDQYRPAGIDDAIPRNLTGVTLALADKLDTLAGCFAVGVIPTGSSDAFALRRAAIGIVKIILGSKLPVSLEEMIAAASQSLKAYAPKIDVTREYRTQILNFILDRARYILVECDGFAYDEVNAAMSASSDDLIDVVQRVNAIREIRKTQNFEPLAVSFKRIRKILDKAGQQQTWRFPAVRPELFESAAEGTLHSAAHKVAEEAEQHKKAGRYREALQGIASLRPVVDAFFDQVLVMAEQEEIRRNRLTLLANLLQQFSTIADFSELAPSARQPQTSQANPTD